MRAERKKPVNDGFDRILSVIVPSELMEKLILEVDRLKSRGRSLSRSDLVRETLWALVHKEDAYSQKHPEFTVAESQEDKEP